VNSRHLKQRLHYIDGMRGLACLIMFQTHCYDAWLSPAARSSRFFGWSQFIGTLAAPSFLFLVGISLALAYDRAQWDRSAVARTTVRRGFNILGLALLFRVQEFILGLPGAPWTDLFRVDILNIIGVSIILVGILFGILSRAGFFIERQRSAFVTACAAAVFIAMTTPLLWTTWRPRFLPWFLESYFDGAHIYGAPQPWLFPVFPWAAFPFAGFAIGSLLLKRGTRSATMAVLAGGGASLFALALALDKLPVHFYPVYDFWHTSPNFLLARVGVLMLILAGCVWWWSREATAQVTIPATTQATSSSGVFSRLDLTISSALVQLGQASLLVYWVHIEFVYGRLSILPKRETGLAAASGGLLLVTVAMAFLAGRRNWLKSVRPHWLRFKPVQTGASLPD
jgi:uncharacterized membrane protein